jgi:hypothetical protein
MKHKTSFVGGKIAFSVCNKPFKPLGLSRGRVKSREGLSEMIPTNIETLCCQQERISTQTMVHTSLACLKGQTPSSISTRDPTSN